jgi:3-oxoacyl-[acyl-carrier-protein] synthase-3
LVEKGDFGETTFILRSDGAGEDAVKIPAGMRKPITKESLDVTEREDGNWRNDLEVYMNGMDVFNFAMSVVPSTIKEVCKTTGTELSEVDYLVFHQANKFMTDFFVKYLRVDKTKVPYCIQKYGNTSSTSVPLTMVSELEGKLQSGQQLIMAGFGAGLSWGVAKKTMENVKISKVIEY